MNSTGYVMRTTLLKPSMWRMFATAIVVALVLQVVVVPNVDAAGSVVSAATVIAAEAATKCPLDAANQSVVNTHTTSYCPMDGLFHSVAGAMTGWSGNSGGRLSDSSLLDSSFPNKGAAFVKPESVLNELDKSVIVGSNLGVFDDPAGRAILRCYRNGILDAFIVSQITTRVNNALRRIAFAQNPFMPSRLTAGDLILGYGQDGRLVRIYRQYLNAGTLIVAGTGSGKTNLSKLIAIKVGPFVSGMWLVDLRKREFRVLRPIFAKLGIDLKVIRCRKFRINPLQVPKGVEPVEYASIAADVLVRVLDLPPRASTLLRSTILRLYTAAGVLEGSRMYPTLFHLYEAIRRDHQANPQARQAAIDNLEAILAALGPEMLAYHCGWPVDELARQHLVLELTGLPEMGKNLVLNYLVTAEFISRIAGGISNPLMDLYVSLDEGQRLFSQHYDTSSYGGNALVDLAGLVRGTGIGLSISVLTTNDLSANIPNLTCTKVIGRCGSATEYAAAGRFVGMSTEQVDWCVHHMVPGLFVGQVSEGSWRYPFLFTVPLVDQIVSQPVADDEADDSIGGIISTPLLPAQVDGRE